MTAPVVLTSLGGHDSPLRTALAERPPLRVGVVQQAWDPDPDVHEANLADGIALATQAGARVVCLQELTLSPYFANTADDAASLARAEAVPDGPTTDFARRMAARHGVAVHASLYERSDDGHPLGYNTAICVGPDGELLARTRKMHIPAFDGYHEDRYFRPGDHGAEVTDIQGARFGFPTCWDQWFPELARMYGLAGADVLVYPTAIGSEIEHPDFDSRPAWEQVIRANGITSAVFMVAVNRIGAEGPIRFYGSSFISDPYGRVLLRAPRYRPSVLVADLDLDQRRDWLLHTRRPDSYGPLAVEAAS